HVHPRVRRADDGVLALLGQLLQGGLRDRRPWGVVRPQGVAQLHAQPLGEPLATPPQHREEHRDRDDADRDEQRRLVLHDRDQDGTDRDAELDRHQVGHRQAEQVHRGRVAARRADRGRTGRPLRRRARSRWLRRHPGAGHACDGRRARDRRRAPRRGRFGLRWLGLRRFGLSGRLRRRLRGLSAGRRPGRACGLRWRRRLLSGAHPLRAGRTGGRTSRRSGRSSTWPPATGRRTTRALATRRRRGRTLVTGRRCARRRRRLLPRTRAGGRPLPTGLLSPWPVRWRPRWIALLIRSWSTPRRCGAGPRPGRRLVRQLAVRPARWRRRRPAGSWRAAARWWYGLRSLWTRGLLWSLATPVRALWRSSTCHPLVSLPLVPVPRRARYLLPTSRTLSGIGRKPTPTGPGRLSCEPYRDGECCWRHFAEVGLAPSAGVNPPE